MVWYGFPQSHYTVLFGGPISLISECNTESNITLQPTASSVCRATMADMIAMATLGWSSLTAGQNVKARTEPERHRATTIEHHLTPSYGMIHST